MQLLHVLNIHVSCPWEPLTGSTHVRVPTTCDSLSLLCLVISKLLSDCNYSFIMTFNT